MSIVYYSKEEAAEFSWADLSPATNLLYADRKTALDEDPNSIINSVTMDGNNWAVDHDIQTTARDGLNEGACYFFDIKDGDGSVIAQSELQTGRWVIMTILTVLNSTPGGAFTNLAGLPIVAAGCTHGTHPFAVGNDSVCTGIRAESSTRRFMTVTRTGGGTTNTSSTTTDIFIQRWNPRRTRYGCQVQECYDGNSDTVANATAQGNSGDDMSSDNIYGVVFIGAAGTTAGTNVSNFKVQQQAFRLFN